MRPIVPPPAFAARPPEGNKAQGIVISIGEPAVWHYLMGRAAIRGRGGRESHSC